MVTAENSLFFQNEDTFFQKVISYNVIGSVVAKEINEIANHQLYVNLTP